MKVIYSVEHGDGYTYYPLISIEEYCCKEMEREFSGEYAREIEYCSCEEKPGLYIMNHDCEEGNTASYYLKYCPDCGEKIEYIEEKA